MSQPITPHQLKRLAAKASAAPEFLAYLLEGYKQRRNISNHELATILGCDVTTIYRLSLCLAPTITTGDEFRDYVAAISDYLPLDPTRLTSLLREVINLSKVPRILPTAHSAPTHIPLAARDHDEPDPDVEEQPDSEPISEEADSDDHA